MDEEVLLKKLRNVNRAGARCVQNAQVSLLTDDSGKEPFKLQNITSGRMLKCLNYTIISQLKFALGMILSKQIAPNTGTECVQHS